MNSTAGSLNLNSAMIMQEETDIPVSGGDVSVRGAIVHIAPGSGIIKRCPVEGCNRALSRQNYCREIQTEFQSMISESKDGLMMVRKRTTS